MDKYEQYDTRDAELQKFAGALDVEQSFPRSLDLLLLLLESGHALLDGLVDVHHFVLLCNVIVISQFTHSQISQ